MQVLLGIAGSHPHHDVCWLNARGQVLSRLTVPPTLEGLTPLLHCPRSGGHYIHPTRGRGLFHPTRGRGLFHTALSFLTSAGFKSIL